MEILKIGEVKTNPFTKKISFLLLDTDNKYFKEVQKNEKIFSKYETIKSSGVCSKMESIDIDNNQYLNSIINNERIIDILDNLIITEKNIYIKTDKSYLRDEIIKELGL